MKAEQWMVEEGASRLTEVLMHPQAELLLLAYCITLVVAAALLALVVLVASAVLHFLDVDIEIAGPRIAIRNKAG